MNEILQVSTEANGRDALGRRLWHIVHNRRYCNGRRLGDGVRWLRGTPRGHSGLGRSDRYLRHDACRRDDIGGRRGTRRRYRPARVLHVQPIAEGH